MLIKKKHLLIKGISRDRIRIIQKGGFYMGEKTRVFIGKSFITAMGIICLTKPIKALAGPPPDLPNYTPSATYYEFDYDSFNVDDCFHLIYRDGVVFPAVNIENLLFAVDPETYEVEKYLIQKKAVTILNGYYNGNNPSPYRFVADTYTYYILYDSKTKEKLCSGREEMGDNLYEQLKKEKICISSNNIGNYFEEYEGRKDLTFQEVEKVERSLPKIVAAMDDYDNNQFTLK